MFRRWLLLASALAVVIISLLFWYLRPMASFQRQMMSPVGMTTPENLGVVNRYKTPGLLDPIWYFALAGESSQIDNFKTAVDAAVTSNKFRRTSLDKVKGAMVPLPSWWPAMSPASTLSEIVYDDEGQHAVYVFLFDATNGRVFAARVCY